MGRPFSTARPATSASRKWQMGSFIYELHHIDFACYPYDTMYVYKFDVDECVWVVNEAFKNDDTVFVWGVHEMESNVGLNVCINCNWAS